MLRSSRTEASDHSLSISALFFFFFNDTPTTDIYTLSLHDALPILKLTSVLPGRFRRLGGPAARRGGRRGRDRKSTRLNSSHHDSSYAVFCLTQEDQLSGSRYPTLSHSPARARPITSHGS